MRYQTWIQQKRDYLAREIRRMERWIHRHATGTRYRGKNGPANLAADAAELRGLQRRLARV